MDLLKDNIRSLYFKFLIPSLGSAMVMSVYTLTDAVVIGKGVGADSATLHSDGTGHSVWRGRFRADECAPWSRRREKSKSVFFVVTVVHDRDDSGTLDHLRNSNGTNPASDGSE